MRVRCKTVRLTQLKNVMIERRSLVFALNICICTHRPAPTSPGVKQSRPVAYDSYYVYNKRSQAQSFWFPVKFI